MNVAATLDRQLAHTKDVGSPLDEYITREDLARQLGKSTRTLDRWAVERTGRPPRTRVGRSIFYSKSELAAWLEQQTERMPN